MELRNCKKKTGAVTNCSPSTETMTIDLIAKVLNVCVIFLICIFLLSTPYPHLTAKKEITYYSSVSLLLFVILLRRAAIKRAKDDFIKGWRYCIMACLIAFFVQVVFSDARFDIQTVAKYTIFAMMTMIWRFQHSQSIRQDEQTNNAISTQEI
jgi:hypothetical protein